MRLLPNLQWHLKLQRYQQERQLTCGSSRSSLLGAMIGLEPDYAIEIPLLKIEISNLVTSVLPNAELPHLQDLR
jgi:hypothetical protein